MCLGDRLDTSHDIYLMVASMTVFAVHPKAINQ